MAEIDGIPRNADKILFAEDLVNYVLHQNTGAEIKPFRVEKYRDFIHNRFNETVIKAITYLDSTMTFIQDDVDALLSKHDVINRDTYQMYAETVYRKYFSKGFEAHSFLNYCAQLAKMAAFLYNNGVLDAPTEAILNIIGTFETVDMNTAEWDIVNKMATTMTSIDGNYPNEFSLETAESCDVGEDEDTILADIEIPQNAEKVLFAEELVYHVMLRNSKVQILPSRVTQYQDKIKPRFNETTRQAIEYLCNKFDIAYFDVSVPDQSVFNGDTYNLQAKCVFSMHFHRGFQLSTFLEYCVDIASLAARFYNKGVPEAPSLAILNIVRVIRKFDMSAGGWNTLNKISEKYATMGRIFQCEVNPNRRFLYDFVKGIVEQQEYPNKNDVVQSYDDWQRGFLEAELNSKFQKDDIELTYGQKCFPEKGSPDFKTWIEKIQEREPPSDGLKVLSSTVPEDSSSADVNDGTLTKHAPTSELCCEQADTDEISTQIYICEVLQKLNSSCGKISVNNKNPPTPESEKQPESKTDNPKSESIQTANDAEN